MLLWVDEAVGGGDVGDFHGDVAIGGKSGGVGLCIFSHGDDCW